LGIVQRTPAKFRDAGSPCEPGELGGALPEQARRPLRVSAAQVLVSDGDLDQSMQQAPARSGGAPPDLFPLVVSGVEVVLVEQP
jgi:hypothetical protein